jgi:hypothetical protein
LLIDTENDAQESEAEEINEYAAKLREPGSKITASGNCRFSFI